MSDERVTTEEAQDLVEFITESEKHGSVRGVLHKVVKRFAQEVIALRAENEALKTANKHEPALGEWVANQLRAIGREAGIKPETAEKMCTEIEHGSNAYPRTLCEKCKGDEVSGCICGMVAQERRGCRVCLISNDDGTCDCASFCADCATLEGKAANDPDTCYPSACPKHGGER